MMELYLERIEGVEYIFNMQNQKYFARIGVHRVEVNFNEQPLGFQAVLEDIRDRKLWRDDWQDERDAA